MPPWPQIRTPTPCSHTPGRVLARVVLDGLPAARAVIPIGAVLPAARAVVLIGAVLPAAVGRTAVTPSMRAGVRALAVDGVCRRGPRGGARMRCANSSRIRATASPRRRNCRRRSSTSTSPRRPAGSRRSAATCSSARRTTTSHRRPGNEGGGWRRCPDDTWTCWPTRSPPGPCSPYSAGVGDKRRGFRPSACRPPQLPTTVGHTAGIGAPSRACLRPRDG